MEKTVQNIKNEILCDREIYIKKSEELYARTKDESGTGLLGSIRYYISGRKDFQEDSLHMLFFKNTEQNIDMLAKGADASDPEDQAAVGDLVKRLVFYESMDLDTEASWCVPLLSALCTPLVPILSKEDAEEIYAGFTQKNPRIDRLPRQEEFAAALADSLNIPKKKRL